MSDHDRWLANYRRGSEEVWCSNPQCPHHRSAVWVEWETEFGQTTVSPEDCLVCHHSWLFDPPDQEEAEDE